MWRIRRVGRGTESLDAFARKPATPSGGAPLSKIENEEDTQHDTFRAWRSSCAATAIN
jgi:hypothetical protein